jgi:CRP-like cAMP-binding protein
MPDRQAQSIAASYEPFEIEKGNIILRSGQVCNEHMILESGCIRSFTLDSEGDEVTTNFYLRGEVVFEVASFFKRIPARETFLALQDCKGWQANYKVIDRMFHAIPEFREMGRMILVNNFIALKEKTLSMIDLTAEQRYEDLLQKTPEIIQLAPLKTIASYLGITDTSLSRIRKEFANK